MSWDVRAASFVRDCLRCLGCVVCGVRAVGGRENRILDWWRGLTPKRGRRAGSSGQNDRGCGMSQSETVDIPILTESQKVLLAELQNSGQNRLREECSYAQYVEGIGVSATIRIRKDKVKGVLYKDRVCLTKDQSCRNLPSGYARLVTGDGEGKNEREINEALQQGPVTVWVLRFATEGGIWVFAAWKNGENQETVGTPHFFTDKVIENGKHIFLDEPLDERYGCWGKLLGKNKEILGEVVYTIYLYSVDDDFSWHWGDAESTASPANQESTDCENDSRKPCLICGWLHDDDLTKWNNPKSENEFYTVIAQKERHNFLVFLHAGMEKNGGDVSLTKFMGEHRKDGKDPKDILGHTLVAVLFESTGRDRGIIRSPGIKRSPGRPKKRI